MRLSLRSLTCRCWPSGALLLSLVLVPLSAVAFTFTNTAPTQCDPFTVNWTGGQPPFNLLILPLTSGLVNITIPSSAFTNNIGSFTVPALSYSQGQLILFTISDAVGLSSGGITSVLTVGPSTSNAQCQISSPTPDFFFSLDGDLEECKTYPFSSYPNAVQPITIFAFVPQGQSFTLHPPIGDNFTWTDNLTAGTSVTFAVIDSQGRSGGSSGIRVVQSSNDQSCISTTSAGPIGTTMTTNNFAPISPTSATSTSTTTAGSGPPVTVAPTVTATVTAGELKTSNKLSVAVAAAAGGVAFVTLVAAFLICMRRRRKKRDKKSSSNINLIGLLTGATPSGDPPPPDLVIPFNLQSDYSSSKDYKPTSGGSSSNYGTSSSYMYAPLQTTEPSLQGHNNPAQHIVVHTDIAETPIDEPVELPPRYSERRTPIPGLISSIVPTSTAPTIIAPMRRKS